MIRMLAVLIALAVVADFTFSTWRQDGSFALIPALIGAIVTAALCWRDAASSRRRRRLALCTCFLAACLCVSLALEIVMRNGSAQALPQMVLLGVLVLVAAMLASNALVASRRRRGRTGFHAYFQTRDDEPPVLRLTYAGEPSRPIKRAMRPSASEPVEKPRADPIP